MRGADDFVLFEPAEKRMTQEVTTRSEAPITDTPAQTAPPGGADVTRPIRPDFIPAEDYRSSTVTALEKQRLWPRVWQMACSVEEIPQPGDYVVYNIGDDSILITRTAADEIRAFYNVCPHRGRRLRDDERGHVNGFWCGFHGWKFDLEGRSTYIHNEEDWAGCASFHRDQVGLKTVKSDTWAGWVWINQDPESEPLSDYLGEVTAKLDPFGFEDCRRGWWKTLIAPVNWKVVVEAFNEGYHVFATHHSGINYGLVKSPARAVGRHGMFWGESAGPGEYRDDGGQWCKAETVQEFVYAANAWLYKSLHALVLEPGMAASERMIRDLADEPDPMVALGWLFAYQREEIEKRGAKWPEGLTPRSAAEAGTDWHIFPHSICLPSLDGALWYRLRPNGGDPDSCIFDIWSLGRWAPGEEPVVKHEIYDGFDAFRGQCAFLEEDFANMQAVNDGMKCRGWEGSRTNPVQEAQIVNFHKVLRNYLQSPQETGKP